MEKKRREWKQEFSEYVGKENEKSNQLEKEGNQNNEKSSSGFADLANPKEKSSGFFGSGEPRGEIIRVRQTANPSSGFAGEPRGNGNRPATGGSVLLQQEASRTCILSKQWLHVWRETTNIEFNENFFHAPQEADEETLIMQRNVFIRFVRQFITNYPQKSIQRFALTCSNPQEFLPDVKAFVGFALSRNVTELELDFSNPNWREDDDHSHESSSMFELPVETYELIKGSVVSLKLFACRFDAYGVSNFSILKSVSLGWIGLSICSIKCVLVNCPLIESLSLKNCWGLQSFEIPSPSLKLKTFVIDKCNLIEDFFMIEGSKLEFLKYSGTIAPFYISSPRNLKEADLDFGLQTEFDADFGYVLYDFLQEIYAAKVLTLCSVFLQIIPQGEEPFGFQVSLDVRHLILKTAMHFNEYFGIRFMLNSCPLLEILTFDIGPAIIFHDYTPPFQFNPHDFWLKNLIVLKCVKKRLRVINVKGFKGTWNELYVLRYLIHFGDKLKRVNLYISNEEGDNGENRETYLARTQFLLKIRQPHQHLPVLSFL
ncbi:F-box protein At3g62230-like [Mercurialis annua]|uniref:F-box protein At3g62230-like n=1 Tax=Mercurialis annua TaxID=3986 RepID=UPI00215DDE09|nr:F-box protein At3g62230-like [Mercurialis annua]